MYVNDVMEHQKSPLAIILKGTSNFVEKNCTIRELSFLEVIFSIDRVEFSINNKFCLNFDNLCVIALARESWEIKVGCF